ncbi:MAG: hypothetical protein WBA93_32705 [Microcoleaceae cyanobacterium]
MTNSKKIFSLAINTVLILTFFIPTALAETRQGMGKIPCSLGEPTHDQKCQMESQYGDEGTATFLITRPDGTQRRLNYDGKEITSPDRGDRVAVGISEGRWFIGINDQEYYIMDEIMVTGVERVN